MINSKANIKFKDIEVVSFDAGFTLLEPNPSLGGILATEAIALGYNCNIKILNYRLFKAHYKYVQLSRQQGKGMYACQKQSKIYWDKITIEAYGRFVESENSQVLADKCYETLARGKNWKLFDDVLAILNQLYSTLIGAEKPDP